MNDINHVRKEVALRLPEWELVRDVVAGEATLKRAGTKYLPLPDPDDTSTASNSRYAAYKLRALFYNTTGRTLAGLVGEATSKEATVELPSALASLVVDADGSGTDLNQHAKSCLSHVLAYGRAGLFVDYPRVAGETTIADQRAGRRRPVIHLLEPWRVINWRTAVVGAERLLSLVVITYEHEVPTASGNQTDTLTGYYALRLVDRAELTEGRVFDGELRDPVYVFENWRPQLGGSYEMDRTVPTDGSGSNFTRLPFTFVGADSNDEHLDPAPLYDLAVVNVAHYRNSADYEESCYLCGQPTPVFTGLTEQWVTQVLKGGVRLGSRAAVPLPAGGAAMLLQAAPNTMAREAMLAKEGYMMALGAKLVEPSKVQKTATEAGITATAEGSILLSAVVNVNKAYQVALGFAGQYANAAVADGCFELNTDIDAVRMDPQSRAQLVAEWQAGALTFTEVRTALRVAGLAFEDDDVARAEAEAAMAAAAAANPDPAQADPNA